MTIKRLILCFLNIESIISMANEIIDQWQKILNTRTYETYHHHNLMTITDIKRSVRYIGI